MGHHYSDTMLTRCGDDNYGKTRKYHAALKKIRAYANAIGAFEPGSFGGTLEMSVPECREVWKWRLKQVVPSLGITRHVIIDHLGCGAFGVHFGKISLEEELEKHLETIRQAVSFHKEYAPNVKLEIYLHTDEDAENNIYYYDQEKDKLIKIEID